MIKYFPGKHHVKKYFCMFVSFMPIAAYQLYQQSETEGILQIIFAVTLQKLARYCDSMYTDVSNVHACSKNCFQHYIKMQ